MRKLIFTQNKTTTFMNNELLARTVAGAALLLTTTSVWGANLVQYRIFRRRRLGVSVIVACLRGVSGILCVFSLASFALPAGGAALQRYYGHAAVTDNYGVIAPWYTGLNGQCDLRVRIAAETLKRYPWTTTNTAIAVYPDYLFTSKWEISSDGVITPQNPGDWMNGDLGQRSTSVLNGMVDYYCYSGDPAAIAHLTYMGNYVLDHALTPSDHPWPRFPISVPTKGVPYGHADPSGMIQLDICGDMGRGLLRAYQVTGNSRWFEATKHWGDLLATNCNRDPAAAPWPRYANPENCPWKGVNEQTGGVVMILSFLDELIRLGYSGQNGEIVAARDAGRRYLSKHLLPRWTDNKTWGLYFWDVPNPEQNCSITAEVVSYLVKNREHFSNWRIDARNILTLFLNRSSADPASGGDVYSGAWAYPESSRCCTRSLWYAPLMDGAVWCQCGVSADDVWARELGYRQLVLQTYDIHETGVSEDNIDGGIIVNGKWLNIAHPWPLRWVLTAIGWLPEELGASCENHLVRSSAVVDSIVYKKGEIYYSTFDAPPETMDVFRLSFVPREITADGRVLRLREALDANGYTVKKLSNGDAIVQIRHDGLRKIVVTGNDPQTEIGAARLSYEGEWEQATRSGPDILYQSSQPGASVTTVFQGNQVRLIGLAGPEGGQAEVFIDGEKQLVPIDFWNPAPRSEQVLYYKNGLKSGSHTLKVVALGTHNPYSQGSNIYVSSVQFSDQSRAHHFPSGTGPTQPQRMIFGYVARQDYRDATGGLWKPAAEIVARSAKAMDTFAAGWVTNAADKVLGTTEPELYRYGYRGHDFWVNVTVGPGAYDLRLGFANTRGLDTTWNCFDIFINGEKVVDRFDVTATAGGPNKAVDLVFNRIAPLDGIVQVRFKSHLTAYGLSTKRGEAFVQALEIGPNLKAKGVQPVSSQLEPAINLLFNSGFEETIGGRRGVRNQQEIRNEWTWAFKGSTNSYIWQERDFQKHPERLPEFHSGQGALRTYSDGAGHTTVFQEVPVKTNATYVASVWVRAADLNGKGFGTHTNDSAGLLIEELNRYNQVLATHGKVETKVAGPYVLLGTTLATCPEVERVRVSLDTVINCHYTEGHVTYDDCLLMEEKR